MNALSFVEAKSQQGFKGVAAQKIPKLHMIGSRSMPLGLLMPIVAACLSAQTPTWNHDPMSASGPLVWGSLAPSNATCGSAVNLTSSSNVVAVGMKQTPINIVSASVGLGVLPELSFRYRPTAMEVENTGHVVEVVTDPGSVLRIGKSATDEYNLVQFHFHAPSEHTIDGHVFDAELHMVHTNILGETLVVGVLLSSSPDATPSLFDQIANLAPIVSGTSAGDAGVEFQATDLLPMYRGFYTYTGSLTTPPCTESVRWIVLTTPVNVTESFIYQLHSIIAAFPGYNGYPNNSRPVLPLNSRPILAVNP
jgi:carbonic anhydrase